MHDRHFKKGVHKGLTIAKTKEKEMLCCFIFRLKHKIKISIIYIAPITILSHLPESHWLDKRPLNLSNFKTVKQFDCQMDSPLFSLYPFHDLTLATGRFLTLENLINFDCILAVLSQQNVTLVSFTVHRK